MNAVNLIPADARRKGRSVPTGLPFLGLVAGLVVVLVTTVLFVLAHDRVESKQSQLAAVQANAARWSAAAASFSRDVALVKARETSIGDVESLVGQRTNWSELLGQLAAVMPAHSQLSSMQATAPASSASATSTTGTAATPAPAVTSTSTPIQLSACAASQSVVAQTMVALRRITGVSDVYLSSSNEGGSGGSSSSSSSSSGSGSGCGYPVTFSVTLAFTPPTLSGAVTATQPTSDTSSTNGASGVSQ